MSDNHEISISNAISQNQGDLTPRSSQNPAFLEVLGHGNEESSPAGTSSYGTRAKDHELVRLWLAGKSTKTQKAYLKVATDLFEFVKGKDLSELKEQDVRDFLALKSWQALDSKKQRAAIIKSLFKFARKKSYIPLDPAEDIESVKSNDKITERYLSEEEVFRMIDRTKDFRNRTILKVLYGSGLRISEFYSLNWEHVVVREEGMGQLTVIGKGSKQRSVLLTSGVFQDLMKLKGEGVKSFDPVFVSREQKRLSVRMLQVIVDQARILAGIERKVSPHWFRHAHSSHALDRGCPIHLLKETLGHVDISTTGKYLKARPNESSGRFLAL